MQRILTGFAFFFCCSFSAIAAEPLDLTLSYQAETAEGSKLYRRLTRQESWRPEETAVIICDVWDSHHSYNAVRRVAEIAPRIDALARELRSRGATIIHAPSDCMETYKDHPARQRAAGVKIREATPETIASWCDRIPAEEAAAYPLDQAGSTEDDDPQQHAQWQETLAAVGRNPALPWKSQTPAIAIDSDRDFISDKGREVWNILEDRGIKNCLLVGVHTNMCVLGRPFGLRQLSQHGKNVALVRDLTDTMYDPKAWPYVSHFSGTDLIVDHIERYVSPTLTSDQILGGVPVHFRHDDRMHLAILIAEDEYETERTLTAFAAEHLRKDFQISIIYEGPREEADPAAGVAGIEAIQDADMLLVSVRRKPLPAEQMQIVKDFVAAAKPVIGIRTASHAFSLRKGSQTPEGLVEWPEFDAQVFGGNYTNHYGNSLTCTVTITDAGRELLALAASPEVPDTFTSAGSLYKAAPLAPGTQVLATGTVPNEPEQPVAWTYVRADGGWSFYTSLGHKGDFETPQFRQMLLNALRYAADLEPLSVSQTEADLAAYRSGHGRQRK